MVYGYARVSTPGQSHDGNGLEVQEQQLNQSGCDLIISETYTGTKIDRPKFTALLKRLQCGDTLKVCKLDRFARTAIEGVQTVQELLRRSVKVHILNIGLIEDTPMGKLILTTLLAFAEFERDTIIERMRAGKNIAKQRADFIEGRPKVYSKKQIDHALSLLDTMSFGEVERVTGISKSTLFRARRLQ
jgi:DNA invertase Pin-like site-specific DNA recombinase